MHYRFEGKQKLLSFGAYPAVSLKDARERRDEAKKLLANDADPGALKKAQKVAKLERAANTFKIIAEEWFNMWKAKVTEGVWTRTWVRLEKDVFPWLGDAPIADIDAPKVLEVLRRMEKRGVFDTVRATKRNISQIMQYAVSTGRAQYDPCSTLNQVLQRPVVTHMAAITDSVKVGELLRAMAAYQGTPAVRAALMLAPLVFVRPGELRAAKWADIDLDAAEWKYIVSKTKTEHLVPLARQSVAILHELQPITGRGKYVFPNIRPERPMSNATMNRALQTMGYDTKTEITGHGFRAMARTLLAEELGFDPLVIEHQLAHSVPDTLGRAYNRTKYLKQRRTMMQAWADYLDRLKAGENSAQTTSP
jgi:integrase